MLGGIIIVIVILALPVGLSILGAMTAGVLGWSLKDDAEARHEGSELVALNN